MEIIDGKEIKEITPELVAGLFAGMNSEEQARFFSHLAIISSDWGFAMRLQYITDDDGLTLAGRRVMQSIGEYSHWGLVPKVTA